MEGKAIEKFVDMVKNRIWQTELQMNPYYVVSEDIRLKGAYEFLILESAKSGKKVCIAYDVEYSSRLDPKWKNTYGKEMKLAVSDLLSEFRDKRISQILNDQ
jgi:hypothetical protein